MFCGYCDVGRKCIFKYILNIIFTIINIAIIIGNKLINTDKMCENYKNPYIL